MKRIVWAAVAVWGALLTGCNSPHVALAQQNQVNVPIGTTYAFQALAQDSNGVVLWNLSGPGSMSNASGPDSVYIAPTTYDPANKTVSVAVLLAGS